MLTYSSTCKKPVRPKRIRFGLLSPEEIRRVAVVRVHDTTLYYRGLPNSGGLLDPLMGSVDRRHLCASCMRDARTCQGHIGYIELAYPMYHTGFIETVLKVLRTTCFMCSRLCATETDLAAIASLSGRTRFMALYNALRGRKQCPHCDATRPTYTRVPLGIRVEWPNTMEWECEEEMAFCTSPFTAREALSILQNLSNADCMALGFDPETAHPKNMILRALVVPPPCTRPAIYASEGSRTRGQNDLTVKLVDCLKRSQELEAYLGVHWHDVTNLDAETLERIARLQYEVFAIVNNNIKGMKPCTTRTGHQQKSLTDRLKGKEGRLRGNLMGKRVDFSARCVITPDPYFSCDCVGIPYSIARTLTVPDTVNASNIASLTQKVRRGVNARGGAQTVIDGDGNVINLEHVRNRENLTLRLGDVVERHLEDDDVVVFNRQPSLHKHGMQAHRVRLMPGHTFRLNLVVAAPYNADFDGDEMNIHVPQSWVARAECATLLAVPQNVIGPQSNKPTMGIVQDSLLGLHLLTLPGTVLTRAHFCRIVGTTVKTQKSIPVPALTIRGDRGESFAFWTGKQVFSKLLPTDLYMEPEKIHTDALDDALVIRAGQLLSGTLKKAHVGTASGGIVDVLCRDCGGYTCCRFFDDAQRLTHAFLLMRSHHVGIHDVMLSEEGHHHVTERLAKATHLCEEIQRAVEAEDVPPDVVITAERSILRLLSKTLMQCGSVVNEHMNEGNAIRRMVGAGSKGTFINLSQICAALGQQSLEGARIISKRGRTLPCFDTGDLTLASRGFVTNSYALGLSPTELFFHAIGGREGLVDTAVKTSQTGYLQRRMNKSFEDHLTHADGSIRNALGEVISFRWGDDGFHPALVERVRLRALADPAAAIHRRMTPRECKLFLALRDAVFANRAHVLVNEIDLRVLLPFNPGRVRKWMARLASFREHGEPDADEEVIALATRPNTPAVVGVALLDLCCASEMSGLARADRTKVLTHLRERIDAAYCPTGEAVGCLAAQSTGEPCTQMTLNTFHFAGVSAKNVTLGIPKLKELIDASKTPKTPLTVVRFREPFASSEAFATYFANTIPLTLLSDIVSKCDIVYDPDPTTTVVEKDRWLVGLDRQLHDVDLSNASSYVVRIELHREIMRLRMLTPPLLRTMLRERFSSRAHVVASEVNSIEWIVRIRFDRLVEMRSVGNLEREQELILVHRAINKLLDTMLVSGHTQVKSANVAPSTRIELCPVDKTLTSKEEYTVLAYGSFLSDCVASDVVEWERCVSNDVWEVLNTLGIEACAHVLFDQLKTVISFDGQYVDDRHLLLIVDTMCRTGKLIPLNRHGINRADTSPLMRASFEETIDVLCDAAMYAEEENACGVTTCIMTGQLAAFGTGSADVLFGEQCIHKPRHASEVTNELPRPKVLRSTCRSFVDAKSPQVVEYVLNEVRAPSMRDLEFTATRTKPRARFRPVSPPSVTKEGEASR